LQLGSLVPPVETSCEKASQLLGSIYQENGLKADSRKAFFAVCDDTMLDVGKVFLQKN
jgi:hypothetical protein